MLRKYVLSAKLATTVPKSMLEKNPVMKVISI